MLSYYGRLITIEKFNNIFRVNINFYTSKLFSIRSLIFWACGRSSNMELNLNFFVNSGFSSFFNVTLHKNGMSKKN